MIDSDATGPNAIPKMRETPADSARMQGTLDTLIRSKGLERWAYFFTTVEGIALPGDLEEYSGCVVDDRGRVFDFWMGLDPETRAITLTTWKQIQPESHWERSVEYRRARERVGLGR